MSEPTVTVYTEQDRRGFAELVNDVHAEFGFGFDPELDADLEDPTAYYGHVWVVRLGGAVVGSVALTPPDNRVTTLKRMYLRPEQRGCGLGRRLLAVAVATARRDGCTLIRLDTSDRQPDAIRLYEAAGFQLHHASGATRYYTLNITEP
ncbi:GNAT family N-acetyltransferase [Flexivirga caeni]|uniref:GNAT family N-acetyltransferase n=1 Tax=Flexivirga caeni TaxID=2294115 RepID=A0A3M9MID7_9MICO|nr:GNAT family N-acetyltransferase [Flexivirga caeni]RNI25322.1 GNAT family N-acetyltransferase [Flexivirga caeni]